MKIRKKTDFFENEKKNRKKTEKKRTPDSLRFSSGCTFFWIFIAKMQHYNEETHQKISTQEGLI